MNATAEPERTGTEAQSRGLVAALAAAALEFDTITPDASNPHFGSRYVTLGALIAATRPALSRHGLAMTQTLDPDANGVALVTTLRHVSGETLDSRYPLPAWKGPQDAGSVLTYLRRYCYAAILNVASEQDDDGEGAEIAAIAAQRPAQGRAGTTGRPRHAPPQKRTQRDLAASSGTLIDAEQLADSIDAAATIGQLDALVPSLATLPAEARPPLRIRFSARRKALEDLARDRRELDGVTT